MAHFISLDEVDGLTPVEWRGERVAAQWERLQAFLARKAPDVAPLFAEPVWSSGDDPGVSWYTLHEGEPIPYSALPPEERDQAGVAIRTALEAVQPLLKDREFGPLLGHCLLVPDLEDVLLVGGRPVLRNWGHVLSGTELPQAWRNGLGRFAPPGWPLPWDIAAAGVEPDSVPAKAASKGGAVPPPVAWWRRPAIAIPLMLVLLLLSSGGSWVVFRQIMPRLSPEQEMEEAETGLRQSIVDERLGVFGGALRAGLCTPEAAGSAVLDENAARGVVTKAMARLIVPGFRNPGRGTAFFVSRDQLLAPEAALAGVEDQPIFVEAPGAEGTFRAERAKAAASGGLVLLHLLQPVRWAVPIAIAPGRVADTSYFAGAFPSFVNPRDASYINIRKSRLDESPVPLVVRGTLAEKPDSSLAPPVPPGGDGAPVVDACGQVIGITAGAGTLSQAAVLDLMQAKPAAACLVLPGFVSAPGAHG